MSVMNSLTYAAGRLTFRDEERHRYVCVTGCKADIIKLQLEPLDRAQAKRYLKNMASSLPTLTGHGGAA